MLLLCPSNNVRVWETIVLSFLVTVLLNYKQIINHQLQYTQCKMVATLDTTSLWHWNTALWFKYHQNRSKLVMAEEGGGRFETKHQCKQTGTVRFTDSARLHSAGMANIGSYIRVISASSSVRNACWLATTWHVIASTNQRSDLSFIVWAPNCQHPALRKWSHYKHSDSHAASRKLTGDKA